MAYMILTENGYMEYRVFNPLADEVSDIRYESTLADASAAFPAALYEQILAEIDPAGSRDGDWFENRRLADLIEPQRFADIVDNWAVAETFDPDAVQVPYANWAYAMEDGRQRIVEAHLSDDDASPNGHSWSVNTYEWSEPHGIWIEVRGEAFIRGRNAGDIAHLDGVLPDGAVRMLPMSFDKLNVAGMREAVRGRIPEGEIEASRKIDWASFEGIHPDDLETERANAVYTGMDGKKHIVDAVISPAEQVPNGIEWAVRDYALENGRWERVAGWHDCRHADPMRAMIGAIPYIEQRDPGFSLDEVPYLDVRMHRGDPDLIGKAPAASGKWGTCDWSIADGVLRIGPGNGGGPDITPPWAPYAADIEAIAIGSEGKAAVFPTDCSRLFRNMPNLREVDAAGADVRNVENMRSMFEGCGSLKSLDIGDWNVSRCDDTRMMLCGCTSLEQIEMPRTWFAEYCDCRSMFAGCESLETLDVTPLGLSNHLDRQGFADATGLALGFDDVTDRNKPSYPTPSMFKSAECNEWDRYSEHYVCHISDEFGDWGYTEINRLKNDTWEWRDIYGTVGYADSFGSAWNGMYDENKNVFGGIAGKDGEQIPMSRFDDMEALKPPAKRDDSAAARAAARPIGAVDRAKAR